MFGHKLISKIAWAEFVLTKQGYDPLIDYLKGLCIIFVIINHSMPESLMAETAFFFWGASAVPIFLIIQVFHAYKRGLESAKPNLKKIWRRIIGPYILAEIVILAIFIIRGHHYNYKDIINETINLIKSGGYGPGAYYPFIYLQFAFIIPFITWIFKLQKTYLCIIFIIISQLSETTCSYFHLSQLAYRLLFIRYIFLLYLGFLLAHKGFILNLYALCSSIICLAFSTYLVYSQRDFSPFLFTFVNPVCHWFCYLYIAYIYLFLLKMVYNHSDTNSIIKRFIILAGKYSYEIFVLQIVYFAIIDEHMNTFLKPFFSNICIYIILKILLPIIICTTPVFIIKSRKKYH